MNPRPLLLALLLTAIFVIPALAESSGPGADADWKAVLALDAGPETPVGSLEQARTVGLAYLAKQETALRAFAERNPGDPRVVDAQLRMARLLCIRSDLLDSPAPYNAAVHLLEEAMKSAPAARRADLAYAKITLTMHRIAAPTESDCEMLGERVSSFQKQFPNDRRLAPLLAELATFYDYQPRHKFDLLKQALEVARDDGVRTRILDDLKRIGLLGTAVAVQGKTADGAPVDVEKFKGKAVLVYFFAGWSPQSVNGLEQVIALRKAFPREQMELVGVSLDPTKEALDYVLKSISIDWPVIWDGQGWESPLVRGLGINTLPTLWIFDKAGKLRSLNAHAESEGVVRSLLKEK